MGRDPWWQLWHNLSNSKELYKVELAEGNCESFNLCISCHGCQGIWKCLPCLGDNLPE